MVGDLYFTGDLIMAFKLFSQSKKLKLNWIKFFFQFNLKFFRFNKDKLEVIVVTSVENEDKYYLPHVTY